MTNEPRERVTEIEAKGGKNVKGMPYVLAISTIAAIVVIGITYAFFVRA